MGVCAPLTSDLQNATKSELCSAFIIVRSAQMANIKSSDQFFPESHLPQIDDFMPFKQVYATLHRENRSGFFLRRAGQPSRYVNAIDLAGDLVKPKVTISDLEELSTTPIGQVLEKPGFDKFSVPIGMTVEADANTTSLTEASAKIFRVQEFGRGVGWFLHSTFLNTTTGRPVWLCSNPHVQHENADFDSGRCSRCPYSLSGVKQQKP